MLDALYEMINLPFADKIIGLTVLLVLALLADVVVRRLGLRLLQAATLRTTWEWDDLLFKSGFFRYLAHAAPFLVIQVGIGLVPHITAKAEVTIRNLALAGTLFFVIRAMSAALSAIQALPPRGTDNTVPIKGYVQLLKILLYVVGTITIIAIVLDRSPLLFLSGLGALSALLLLIFKDTLLSFVASVQISTNDMLRLDDWIEMPSAGADGAVIDISLHTVKVRNWDMTVTTIPTWKLISESFRNWRSMFESGGRRLKRAVHLDASRVRFLNDQELITLRRFRLLDAYLDKKVQEVRSWNEALGEAGQVQVNQRRLTNLGLFRIYAQAYLDNHPGINHDMICMVRQLTTQGEGIPLELYAFTATTAWVPYEAVQADIFDHLFAILPEFDLALYQKPAGADLRRAVGLREPGGG